MAETPVLLERLPALAAAEWDGLMAQYPDATVYHLSSWHRCLERSFPGTVVRFAVLDGDRACGHWCGFLVKKFGVRVFGAPLPGTGVDYLHPLFSHAPSVPRFLAAVRAWAEQEGIALVELGGRCFSVEELGAAGYRARCSHTYRVDISGGAEEVWSGMKPAMRNKVRKAEKSGVTVEFDTSPEFPRRYIGMLKATFGRQGLVPTYGLERVETIVDELIPSGNAATFTASLSDDAVAAIILLLDGTTAYFWGGASYRRAYEVGANDIIHWHALQYAIEKGLAVYDTSGGGDYKTKFGGVLTDLPAGYLGLKPWAGVLRATVHGTARLRQTALGHLLRARRADR